MVPMNWFLCKTYDEYGPCPTRADGMQVFRLDLVERVELVDDGRRMHVRMAGGGKFSLHDPGEIAALARKLTNMSGTPLLPIPAA